MFKTVLPNVTLARASIEYQDTVLRATETILVVGQMTRLILTAIAPLSVRLPAEIVDNGDFITDNSC